MNKNVKKTAEKVVKAYINKKSEKTDPLGSYTGVAKNKKEKPVQDADDL